MHVKLNHSGYIPDFVSMTTAKVHESQEIKNMPIKKGDVLVFDRGYNDYEQFSNYCDKGIYFISRLKSNAVYEVIKEQSSEIYQHIGFDKTIRMVGFYASRDCRHKLRIIESYDPETDKTIVLLTNQYTWSPETIAAVYKDRWQIEIFFKTIKQNLKIESFFGTSRNAVYTQIWIALIAFLLLKYLADSSTASWPVGMLMSVIPVMLFLKKDIWIWLNKLKPDPGINENYYGQMEFPL
jgi:IS4 transposase